jgi:PHD/YefM family antitoxin component YafN of YafNO toxin-antitoxin module
MFFMETVNVDKNLILDLAKGIEELNSKMEALELSSDPEIMESLKKSKDQIKNGELVGFDEL